MASIGACVAGGLYAIYGLAYLYAADQSVVGPREAALTTSDTARLLSEGGEETAALTLLQRAIGAVSATWLSVTAKPVVGVDLVTEWYLLGGWIALRSQDYAKAQRLAEVALGWHAFPGLTAVYPSEWTRRCAHNLLSLAMDPDRSPSRVSWSRFDALCAQARPHVAK